MADLLSQLEALAAAARRDVAGAADERALEDLRVRFLGKRGELSAALRGMGQLPAEERPRVGEVANRVRDEIEALLAEGRARLARAELEAELSGPPLDPTLPGRRLLPRGHRHPITQAAEEIAAIFGRLGYEVANGPEIELDWYNFEALRIAADHPARDMQDTFYVDAATLGGAAAPRSVVLRTHTSPVQIRAMKRRGRPPIRVICPGRVYRSDYDQTHSPMFHQVEGLCVDEGITFADLKGTLAAFARAYFGPGTRTRFRPSYFPFVEPGAEVDVSCSICGGTGKKDGKRCGTCKETGWVEVLGSGMVHPEVLANGGMPAGVTGFAFGFGVERMAMLRYRVDDLRLFFENDLRFLEQF
ncbi:phenylalanine--tRNA ligase subunit alpha [Anaeromyxobacter diazotrophicus]|uniref:Phenylalanine--tRNA ligase alpha subunit n=1 Tax=Anaeromyxobacter diazotrophicus TaxID=2590199 RepID=A0A7I9VPI6_9BACT|nr:phenylalanine--tRNA ligase subunit alpha [Anaeromyxobacter diazotrophicus]GEJ58271.1 phenylalanine--tRNA ligase alpha subunit [Anaeromyxobacter diazotrophicus]